MNFEHLIEINSDRLPTVEPLSRARLWRGLVIRAERPKLFVLGLDACTVEQIDDQHLRRELHFGSYQVRDQVRLIPQEAVVFDVEATASSPASTLVMRIEEPEAGRLFLRFTYTSRTEGDPATPTLDDFVAGHLKQAYTQADIDTVKVIRDLASQGLLDDH